jgi:hypothetical protein
LLDDVGWRQTFWFGMSFSLPVEPELPLCGCVALPPSDTFVSWGHLVFVMSDALFADFGEVC